jgi:hypothetical protein
MEPDQAAAAGDPRPPASRRLGNLWWLLLVAVVTAALCLPFLRSMYWFGDEGELLHGAERMLHGNRLYADFFEFLPPGGFVLTAAWLRIVGISVLSARSLAIVTIVGVACFTYLASRRASGSAPLSALFTIGWVLMSQGPWTVVSHHWFTTLFSMIAAWAALASMEDERRSLRWPLIAGTAAGMATVVIETQGALVMVAALFAFVQPRQRPAELLAYLLGCALVPVGLLAYLVESHALVPAFDDVILWTAGHYASIQGVPFAWQADAQNWPLGYLFIMAITMTVVLSLRNRRARLLDRTMLLCVGLGLAGFMSCFPRPDMVHIEVAIPLILPLLLLSVADMSRWWHPASRYVAIMVMIAVAVSSAHAYLQMAELVQEARIIQTPRGRIGVIGLPGAGRLFAQIAETPRGDAYFFYPYMPMMPFLTGRRDVSRYDIFTPDYTLPSQYQKACISVMRHASWIVIDRHWTDPKTLKEMFPAMRNPRPPETRRFERALSRGFRVVATDGTFELGRRRTSGVDPGLCSGIAG